MSKANEKMYRTIYLIKIKILTFCLLNFFNSYSLDVQDKDYQTKIYFYASEDHHYKDIEPTIFYLNKMYSNNEDLNSALSEVPELKGKKFFIKEQEEENDSVIIIAKNNDE